MADFKYLKKIKSPNDLQSLSLEQLNILCEEIREQMIETVSQNGGHLSSNLGTVELTVALHRVFNGTDDSIVFDVGHQCYTHKMLTGRFDSIDTIRTEGGISGFPKREESPYDAFNVGHSSTSISAAYGIARGKELLDIDGSTVAVIGDGALTGGLAYEGLNNAGRSKKNFIVVLNDNHMSISRNVGAVAKYLKGMRINPKYLKAKSRVEKGLSHTPILGNPIRKIIRHSKSTLRNMVYKSTLFDDMGFAYYGPVDGHDLHQLINTLNAAKHVSGPVLVHAVTVKGKGYSFAENDPKGFHGISAFDIETGEPNCSKVGFSAVFGKKLCEMAKDDKRICAITAAMAAGTGLTEFASEYKDRFFDVGIAEAHAVTFAGGLAAEGVLPVFAVYSTFLQRSIDQIIHDLALQKLHVIIAVDRAGIVGEDGETHQGVFDVSLLNPVPNVIIYSPCYFDELEREMQVSAYTNNEVIVIRYPRGSQSYRPKDFHSSKKTYDIYGDQSSDILIITYGRIFSNCCIALDRLAEQGKSVCILKLNRIKPIPKEAILFAQNYSRIFFFEEGMATGGVGEHFDYELSRYNYNCEFTLTAIDDKYIKQAPVQSSLKRLSLDCDGIVNVINGIKE
ncbi:MAG TPA: 1-deoxy-D-xylulose-5-phosphate synthase [Clostridiales bacterium]|nr:1-deoxy-D-xylulose-5-phosphate synthase [Clostridiales bacterium]